MKSGYSSAEGADNTGKVQIDANGVLTLALVDKANKLAQTITLSIDGDVTGSTTTDGSANATITVALPTQTNIDTTKGYTKVRFNSKGIAVSGDETITLADVSDAGTAASKNTGTAAGNVPILGVDGKLDTAVLPALATGETKVVADDAARFALTTADVQEGDLIITSGYGGVFPKGLPVGLVTELKNDDGGLLKIAVLEPAVDFQKLEDVAVIVASREAPPEPLKPPVQTPGTETDPATGEPKNQEGQGKAP